MRLLLIFLCGCAANNQTFSGSDPKPSTCEILSPSQLVRWSDGIYRDSQVSRCKFGSETCLVYKSQGKIDLNCEN